jgi:hypothetical protein
VYTQDDNANDSWQMDVQGDKEDLTWLVK